MSVFGTRIAYANRMIDLEYSDLFDYQPMTEVVNATPEVDPTRTAGTCRAILLQAGKIMGSGHSLNAMHERSTSEPELWFMARGILADVRRFDRFALTGSRHNPDRTGTRVYEVGDGPRPVGFGRYQATLVEISGPDIDPVPMPSRAEAPPAWEDIGNL